MSYIKQNLDKKELDITKDIIGFCIDEGFKTSFINNEISFEYKIYGELYNITLTIYNNKIEYYVEYECGGEVDSMEYQFENYSFMDFKKKYKETIDYLTRYAS